MTHDAISRLPSLRIHALTDGKRHFRMKTWRGTTVRSKARAERVAAKRAMTYDGLVTCPKNSQVDVGWS